MKLLFFGDIVGKISRQALKEILPHLKKELRPDLIIANGENLAHGLGLTEKTIKEMNELGINILTSGNHVWDKKLEKLINKKETLVLRPANYPPGVPGKGYKKLTVKTLPTTSLQHGKSKKLNIYVINLIGRVFFREDFDCPFRKYDQLEKSLKLKKNDIIIVDFHSEATSEKTALGFYLDGRASAVLGTHTHIPTCDHRILPQGTAYVSDIGMVGARDSVIGVEKQGPLKNFLSQLPTLFEIPLKGWVQVNTVLVEIDNKTGKAKRIERVDREVKIE